MVVKRKRTIEFLEGIKRQLEDIQNNCDHDLSDPKLDITHENIFGDYFLIPDESCMTIECFSQECRKCGFKKYIKSPNVKRR